MEEKKTLSAKMVLADFMNGLSDDELMTKYQISAKGLQSLIDKMIASGMLKRADVEARAEWIQSRQELRHRTVPPLNESSVPAQGTSKPSSPQVNPDQRENEEITVRSLFGDWHENKRTLILLLIFATPIGLYGLYKTSLL